MLLLIFSITFFPAYTLETICKPLFYDSSSYDLLNYIPSFSLNVTDTINNQSYNRSMQSASSFFFNIFFFSLSSFCCSKHNFTHLRDKNAFRQVLDRCSRQEKYYDVLFGNDSVSIDQVLELNLTSGESAIADAIKAAAQNLVVVLDGTQLNNVNVKIY